MKKYAVSKETFNYITAILADKPSHLLHDWRQWLDANNVGSASYSAIKELSHFDRNPSIVITELLQGKAELELDEKKYRLYHKQNSDLEQFAYHYFTKSGVLQDSDDFDDVSVLGESNVKALADYEGLWVWGWAHEVKDND
jgi:hypothetical protein